MKKMKLILATIALIGASSASAITVTGGNGGGSADFTLLDDSVIDGAFGAAGNDAGAQGIQLTDKIFGLTGWTLADKNDDGNGDKTYQWVTAPENGDQSGTWEIAPPAGTQPPGSSVMIVLKAGSGYGAFDLTDFATNGTWESTKGLSHASVWWTSQPGVAPSVPDAGSTLALMGIALAGLGALKRRK